MNLEAEFVINLFPGGARFIELTVLAVIMFVSCSAVQKKILFCG